VRDGLIAAWKIDAVNEACFFILFFIFLLNSGELDFGLVSIKVKWKNSNLPRIYE